MPKDQVRQNAYARKHYAANAKKQVDRVAKRRKELMEFVQEIKTNGSCADCGESFHPVAMNFDHTSDDKHMDISNMIKRGYCKERILEEMAKCELVCAVHHRIRTYMRSRAIGSSSGS
jgi:hypothetical protein